MKVVETIDVFAKGPFPKTPEWAKACADVEAAVRATDWPHGSGSFTILPKRKGNGVVPIKRPCVAKLQELGWTTECLPPIESVVLDCGELDALYQSSQGYIGFEWETGNISSSHRAINKLLLTLKVRGLVGGILAVPSDRLKPYLTDRIGNIGELRPYFPLWDDTKMDNGALRIVVAEHDAESPTAPRIPKGKDGNARKRSQRKRKTKRKL